MNLTIRIVSGLLIPYALFFSWYTSFGGPLSPDEIEHYVRVLDQAGARPE